MKVFSTLLMATLALGIVFVASASAATVGGGTAVVSPNGPDEFGRAWAACLETRDANSDECYLAQELSGCANVHLDATEHGEQLIFLHAVRDGPANQSYGLQVARLAGVPKEAIARARRYLAELERGRETHTGARAQQELPLFEAPASSHPALERLEAIDPDALSPREALEELFRLRSLLKDS